MAELITKTFARKPKAATHWSVHATAQKTGIAKARFIQLFGLPNRTRSFNLSTDPSLSRRLSVRSSRGAPPSDHTAFCSPSAKATKLSVPSTTWARSTAIGQPQVIKAMIKRHASDGDPKLAHVVGRADRAPFVGLAEDDLLLLAMDRRQARIRRSACGGPRF